MPKLFEGQDVNDPATMKLVDEINKEEEAAEVAAKVADDAAKAKEEAAAKAESDGTSPGKERPVETMTLPKWKVLDNESKIEKLSAELDLSKKEREELNVKLEELSKNPPKAVDEEIQAYAESMGAEPSAIQGLLDIFSKRFSPPADYQKVVEAQKKREEEERLKTEAFAEFESDFKALAEKNPEVANLKERIKELAFSDSYHTYSLAHIFQLEKDNLVDPKRKTGEGTRGKAEGGKIPQKIENIDEMSDKEFTEFSEKLSKEGTMAKLR